MRADFYSRCLDHTELSLCLEANLHNVPRMKPPQLQEAIEQRLALAAATAEKGLVDALLTDVGRRTRRSGGTGACARATPGEASPPQQYPDQ